MTRSANLCAATAALIREHGWIQEAYVAEGGYCLVGALCTARRRGPFTPSDQFDAHRLIRNHLGSQDSLTDWNDHPDRTRQEVLNVLDRIAAQ